jgi:O-antigen ligase
MRSPRLTLAGAMVLLPLVLFDWSPAADPLMATESYSLETRIAAAESMRDLIAHSPLIGFGPSNYHFYTPLFPILGYRVMFASHNNYIDVAAQAGIVGLAAFIVVLIAVLWTTTNLARRFSAGFEKAYLMGAMGGVIATACSGMLGDWIIPFVYNVGVSGFRSSMFFWLFAGGVLAIDRMVREQQWRAELPWASARVSRGALDYVR